MAHYAIKNVDTNGTVQTIRRAETERDNDPQSVRNEKRKKEAENKRAKWLDVFPKKDLRVFELKEASD